MESSNRTMVTYFVLKGITNVPRLEVPISLLVLLMYLLTLGGNMTILLLVCSEPQLHTPMYFFLCNLSVLDISSSTATLHRIFVLFFTGDNRISVFGCMTQIFMFLTLTTDQLLLLAAMSFDRYVAVCDPMHYSMVMNRTVCALLAASSWLLGIVEISPIFWTISGFSCYRSNEINHFLCDIIPLMKLSCNDKSFLELYLFTEGYFVGCFCPFLMTFVSYVLIIITILKIPSSNGRRKTFYTCSSHLTVVVLLYATLVIQYLSPNSTNSLESNKLFSLFNTATVPLLNPLVYSLKNNNVKSALRRRLRLCKLMF
ncbi:olfactory receptor 5B21-like [Spea bombifrons]|uniref:olfactory receptor 5B21-like n=1 Tax=Spea bombifrons TaxID=233779 RepID=UPI00234BC1E5|nr:olfactory receptor 5B21-like [Spea bombifrons]